MRTFKNIVLNSIAESRDSSDYGFSADGQALSISISKSLSNNLMEMTFSGNMTLSRVPSVEDFKTDTNEKSWIKIEKNYKKISEKYSKDLEKSINDYEKKLNDLVISFEKNLNTILNKTGE